MNQYKRHTEEFKDQAVGLAESMGNTSAAAQQLGISDSAIRGWRKKRAGSENLSKSLGEVEIYEDNKKLRKENIELKKVNQILKAAAAFFSQDHLK